LKICDKGIGITKAQQEDIYKRYHRFNKERGGFGIGLSIVLDICRENGIVLSLESEVNKGSCFFFDLSSICT